jgi:hypothetical protein
MSQAGQVVRYCTGKLPATRLVRSTPVTFGMISPPFSMKERIPLVDAQPHDFVGVVQRSPLNGSAGQGHGFEDGHRRNGPGAAYVVLDLQQGRGRVLGLVLVGNGPAGTLAVKPSSSRCP